MRRIYHDESGSIVTISMIDLPKLRHRRTVAKSNLDFISIHFCLFAGLYQFKILYYLVSIGGICGLFFGISFISIIDFIYNFVKGEYF